MISWPDAHRIAMIAATHARERFKVDPTRRVPIFDIIETAGIILGFEPIGRLSGAYISEKGIQQGILVNSAHPLARQRFTAAHELGHHWQGDNTSVDPEVDPLFRWGTRGQMPDEERIAEAFAAWFLMPPSLIRSSLKQLGQDRPKGPADAYQLSLLIGVSYEATVRHLQNLRLVKAEEVDSWLKVSPASLKRELAGEHAPQNMRNDVWLLGNGQTGVEVVTREGDRLIVDLEEIPSSGYFWTPSGLPTWMKVLAEEDLPSSPQHTSAGAESDDGPVPGGTAVHRFVLDVAEAESRGQQSIMEILLSPPWAPQEAESAWSARIDVEPDRRGVAERWFTAA